MRLPSTNPITLPFGATTDPYTPASPHNGTDFAYTPDEHIYAPFSGKVILKPNNGNDGNGIYMYDGPNLHGMLHSQTYLVSDGQQVTEGQPLGIIGATGYAFGRHLHWCVKVNNKFINPMDLVKGEIMASQDIADETTIRLIFNLGMERDISTQELASRLAARQTVEKVLRDVWTSDEHAKLISKSDPTDAQKKLDQIKQIVG